MKHTELRKDVHGVVHWFQSDATDLRTARGLCNFTVERLFIYSTGILVAPTCLWCTQWTVGLET